MAWKYAPSPHPSVSPPSSHPSVDPSSAAPPSHTSPPGDFSFSLEVLDVYTLDVTATIPCSDQELPIQALVKSGYLGNTPKTPSIAISFKTLELFMRLRLRKSSFSVEAFAKVVCDLYSVSPHLNFDTHRCHVTCSAPRCHTAGATVLLSLTRSRSTSLSCEPLKNSSVRNSDAILRTGG
jgi:hypothetical protein